MCVDDHDDICSAISRSTRYEHDIECVGAFTQCREALAAAARLNPHVILLDLSMPGEDPLEYLPQFLSAAPGARVVIFSGHDDHQTQIAARTAGAVGFVSKHSGPQEVFRAVRSACRPA